MKKFHSRFDSMQSFSHLGQQLQEFMIILGLVVIIAVGIGVSFSKNIMAFFQGTSGNLQSSATGTSLHQSSTSSASSSTNLGTSGQDPFATGHENLPQLQFEISLDGDGNTATIQSVQDVMGQVTHSGNGQNTNVTSELGLTQVVDYKVNTGTTYASSSMKIAKVLDALANSEPDTKSRAHLQELSQLAYLISAVQASLDDIPEFKSSVSSNGFNDANKIYTHADGLRDLMTYSAQFNSLLETPPPGMDIKTQQLSKGMGQEMTLISSRYKSALSSVLDEDGQVDENWSNDPNCKDKTTCDAKGKVGKVFSSAKDKTFNTLLPPQGWQYDQIRS
ncbi:MAG: hypothetical protein K2X66_10450, partial [Cyanobacteria bacterium]|nr:hypothetical protein [Cyanobacteriota bacterium]